MLKNRPPHPQPVNKAKVYMGEDAHDPSKPLLSWDLGFALAGSRGLPSLLWCGVGTGVAGGRRRAGKAITGSAEKAELCCTGGQCFSSPPQGILFG